MDWVDWIFTILLIGTTWKIVRYTISHTHLLTFALSLTFILVALNFISYRITEVSENYNLWSQTWNVHEWLEIGWIAFFLAALALIIRHVKPEFARFPRAFAILPLLIVPTHYLGINTLVLKQWVVAIYLGGALLISFLLCGVWFFRDRAHWKTLVAIVLFIVSFLIEWNPFFDFKSEWNSLPISLILNSVGMIFFYKGLTTTLSIVLYPKLDSKTGTVNEHQQS